MGNRNSMQAVVKFCLYHHCMNCQNRSNMINTGCRVVLVMTNLVVSVTLVKLGSEVLM